MDKTNRDMVRKSGSWARVGVLTLTTLGPIVNTLIERMRQRSQAAREQEQLKVEQPTAFDRLEELTLVGRQRAAEQARQLQIQMQQLQVQARQLREALRDEARQRKRVRKLTKQLRNANDDLREGLAKRGEYLTEGFEGLVEQGSKSSQGFRERSGKVAQDLAERSSKATRNLTRRGGKLTHDLSERSSEVAQDLAERGLKLTHGLVGQGRDVAHDLIERGEHLFQSKRRRSTFWTIFGFAIGLVGAGVVTYVLVRRRVAEQEIEAEQQFELPQNAQRDRVGKDRPAGEILYFDQNGAAVATLQVVDVEERAYPVGAAFVGVASTKRYYPVDTPIDRLPLAEDGTKDLVYFPSEEEAKAQGFSPEE